MNLKKGVEFVRNELGLISPDYQMLSDCLVGERAIKGMLVNDISSHLGEPVYRLPNGFVNSNNDINAAAAQRYLPKPQASDEIGRAHV